jgi:hydrogenase nickel incorporation protein HypA/HybF
MHEAGAAQAIVGMLEAEALAKGATRVTSVRVVAGETAAYMEESLAFYLGFFAKGTCVEGVKLEFKTVKPRLRCRSCSLEFERKRFSFDCPACGGEAAVLDLGTEFHIESAELEGEADAGQDSLLPARSDAEAGGATLPASGESRL